jgi:hypothetical protein
LYDFNQVSFSDRTQPWLGMVTTKKARFPNVSIVHLFFATSSFTNVLKTHTLVMTFSNVAIYATLAITNVLNLTH